MTKENNQLKKDLKTLELALKRSEARKALPLHKSTGLSEANSTIIKNKNAVLQEFIKDETIACDNEVEPLTKRPTSELSNDPKYSSELVFREDMELNYDDNKGWGKLNVLSMKHFGVSDSELSTYYGTVRCRSNDYDMLNIRVTNLFKKPQNPGKFKHEFAYSK